MKGLRKAVEQIVEHALRGAGDVPCVVLGPVAWTPNDDGSKRWYFTIATADDDKDFRLDQIVVPENNPQAYRTAVFAEFINRRPLVVHDTDDELAMAKLCEALWPGERITKMRQDVEAERGA